MRSVLITTTDEKLLNKKIKSCLKKLKKVKLDKNLEEIEEGEIIHEVKLSTTKLNQRIHYTVLILIDSY